ncbi:Hypothetical predicted protein [Cloeon dipterum]|uniref:Uncharacterized protein n=1 Tax=Cloeon dipterum TaxID=197152 RepID=A0A8S1DW30_9INSE|nr:Hypothetical predicted protein [Cloeon dipterum]
MFSAFLLRDKLLEKVTCQKFVDIDEEEKDLHSRIDAFELLLCPQIKKIKLEGLMAVGPGTFELIMEIITTRAPNLISLKIIPPPYRPHYDFPPPNYFLVSLTEIGKLAKLRKLVLRSSMVDYEQLKEMCRNELRNLEYLDVSLNFDSDTNFEDVEDFKECFSNLQYFLFDPYSRDESFSPDKCGVMLRKMCIKHLSNLINVDWIARDERQVDIIERFITDLPSEVSSLQHLSVTTGTVEIHRAFPNITRLNIYFDDHDIDIKVETLLQFQNIKRLFLTKVTSLETVNKFIRCYGPKLKTLYLAASETNDIRLKFKSIFKSCPRLEILALTNVDMVDDGESMQFFSKLKNLFWLPNRGRSVCLSNIIQAPDLQMVTFNFGSFDVDDLRKVSDLIAKKTILRKLQALTAINCYIVDPNDEMDYQSYMVHFNAISDLIKNASAFLPCFINFDLGLHVEEKYWETYDQALDCHCRFIEWYLAAILKILDKDLIEFYIAFKRNYLAN